MLCYNMVNNEFAFYVDISFSDPSHNNTFETLMSEYFERYMVGRELSQKEKREHYQCYAIGYKPGSYNNFIAKIKKEFPHLCGKAKKGQRRNYGRIKDKLKDPENMKAYCVKDGDYFWKGYGDDEVAERYAASYQKPNDTELSKYNKFVADHAVLLSLEVKQCLTDCHLKRDYSQFNDLFSHITETVVHSWRKEFQTLISKNSYKKLLYDLGILDVKYYSQQLMSGIFPGQFCY